ncbi:MAG: hypothetical protein SF002_08810 [Alphaproteobacteria bacterium]|nr:hypothetical protein [Alphaproteobacteria bacterium]
MCLARGIFAIWALALGFLAPSASFGQSGERFERLMEQAFQAMGDRIAGDNVRLRTTDRTGAREVRQVFDHVQELALMAIDGRSPDPAAQAYLRAEGLRAGLACVSDILARSPVAAMMFRAIDPDLLINLDTVEYREIQQRYIQENGLRLSERTQENRRQRAQAYVSGRLLMVTYCQRIGDQVNRALAGG